MNNTFYLQQKSQIGNLDSSSILRRYKLDLMSRFMGKKSTNPRSRQDEIAKDIGCSSSSLQRYRQDIKMPSTYMIPPNTHKKNKRFQIVNMASKDLRCPCS